MLRSRFFWKLYLSYVLVVVVTCGILGFLVHFQWSASLRRAVENSLREKIGYLTSLGPDLFEEPEAFRDSVLTRFAENLGARVTLLDPKGRVLVDAEGDGEDLSAEPEVVTALQGGWGFARRYSPHDPHPRVFAARAVGDPVMGVVRISVPASREQGYLRALRKRIALAALSGMMVALLLGWLVARRILIPIGEMRAVAESMRREDYQGKVKTLPRDEIGLLGDTFNRVSRELTHKIAHLVREESHLRAILASMVEGVVAVDGDDTVLFSNPAARSLLSQSESTALTGRRLWEFTDLRRLRDLVEQVRESGRPLGTEVVLRRDISQEMHLDVRGAAFEGPDRGGVILVVHDVTNLRRLERIRRDFVANVSHELKTPLTSIKGYVETLLGGALHDERHNERFLRKINKHVIHLTDLVSDLLQLGRIEGEGVKLKLGPVEWNEVVRDVLGRHELDLEARGLTCEFRRSRRPVLVKGDTEAMRQIADNLLTNAIKYTREGGRVTLSVSEEEGMGCLSVEDTGIGIPEAELSRIFERFYRVDKARSDGMGGTGLGLSIVKHLVSSLGGEIRVESRVGHGSRFRVLLPLRAREGASR